MAAAVPLPPSPAVDAPTANEAPAAPSAAPEVAPAEPAPLERIRAILYYEDPAVVEALLAQAQGDVEAAVAAYLASQSAGGRGDAGATSTAAPSVGSTEDGGGGQPTSGEAAEMRQRSVSAGSLPQLLALASLQSPDAPDAAAAVPPAEAAPAPAPEPAPTLPPAEPAKAGPPAAPPLPDRLPAAATLPRGSTAGQPEAALAPAASTSRKPRRSMLPAATLRLFKPKAAKHEDPATCSMLSIARLQLVRQSVSGHFEPLDAVRNARWTKFLIDFNMAIPVLDRQTRVRGHLQTTRRWYVGQRRRSRALNQRPPADVGRRGRRFVVVVPSFSGADCLHWITVIEPSVNGNRKDAAELAQVLLRLGMFAPVDPKASKADFDESPDALYRYRHDELALERMAQMRVTRMQSTRLVRGTGARPAPPAAAPREAPLAARSVSDDGSVKGGLSWPWRWRSGASKSAGGPSAPAL